MNTIELDHKQVPGPPKSPKQCPQPLGRVRKLVVVLWSGRRDHQMCDWNAEDFAIAQFET